VRVSEAFCLMAPDPIRTLDMRLINDLFEMHGGYVLDFSDRTFGNLFRDEIGIDIDNGAYEVEGTSKAKRFRYFLQASSAATRRRALIVLWEYRQDYYRRGGRKDPNPNAASDFERLLDRIAGESQPAAATKPASPEVASQAADAAKADALKARVIQLYELSAQTRGFEYERFLKDLFAAHALSPRASFRLVGEQIDGSFELANETYLLEAKWQAAQVGAADLRSFNAKVEDKASWSRGLFVSHSGFSDDGLQAFGRGKRVVCMDGFDLWEMLDRKLSFATVLSAKVRRAAESGNSFVRVRDLFG
jgi:hypothetical protein